MPRCSQLENGGGNDDTQKRRDYIELDAQCAEWCYHVRSGLVCLRGRVRSRHHERDRSTHLRMWPKLARGIRRPVIRWGGNDTHDRRKDDMSAFDELLKTQMKDPYRHTTPQEKHGRSR
jgi:hypothetical protein